MNLRFHIFVGQILWIIAYCGYDCKSFRGERGIGRNLIIKTLPPVEDYQSNVYEVVMEPYVYPYQRAPISGDRTQKQILDFAITPGLKAVASIDGDGEEVKGKLIFTQLVPNGPVMIDGNLTGLSPGLHGLHIHHRGYTAEGCVDIGPHYIAYYGRHGGPRDPIRHVGDLGNIKVEEGQETAVKLMDHLITLSGPRTIVGRSIGISKGEDDYGRAGTEDSALTGSSGPTIACGVIGYLN